MKKHLHNSLRALLLSLSVLLSLPMLAVKVEIDGINYELNADAKQAAVIKKSSGEYSGSIVIPESVEHEGVAYSVTSIGDYAFWDCSGLTSVTIPNSVTSMGGFAFYYCTGLTSVTIPNSVTSIGDYAFYYCTGLTSITIGNSVTSIGEMAFWTCDGLTSVHISDIAAWCNIDFDASYSNPLSYAHHLYLNGEEVKDLVIPNSVKSIGVGAFGGCSGLTSVTIPNSVTSIESGAFAACSGLTSVTIPNSVTSIGVRAFDDCSGLTSVTIGNSVTSIGNHAFYNCDGLTSVTIGSGVKSIGKWAFASCSELLDVYCYAENVPFAESNAFDRSYPENATLHVPAASLDSYRATAPWSSFGKIVALTPEESGIDELKGENGKVKTALYDLSGRRGQKGQKGVFIQNGKVMVR